MSDSGEPMQESQLTEDKESKPQQDEVTKNLKKRELEDEDSEEERSRVKPTERNLEDDLEPTEGDALPLDCSICNKPFLNPVITKCNHFFCKQCALNHHTVNNKCYVCKEPTLGVFNTAVEINERIAIMREISEIFEQASEMAYKAKALAQHAVNLVKDVETMVVKVVAMATEERRTAAKTEEMKQP